MTEPSIRPFPGFVVKPGWASRVATGAFDGFTPEERQRIAAEQPHSYLNVTRSPDDYLPGLVPPLDEMLREGRVALDRLLAIGAFEGDGADRLYCYRLQFGAHEQLGMVGLVSVDDYLAGGILEHEGVRPDRVELLARHIELVRATSSPVALTFRPHDALAEVTRRTSQHEPLLDFVGVDGLRQTVWPITPADVPRVQAALAERRFYITDGHHRLAAAAAVRRRDGSEATEWTLASLFPADELRVLSFHRRVIGPLRAPVDDLVGALARVGDLDGPHDRLDEVEHVESVSCYLDGRWYRLTLPEVPDDAAPVDRLDASRIQNEVLGPVFGVDRPTDLDQVEYIAAPIGIPEVLRRCDADDGAAFVLTAPTVEQILAVADSGGRTPPKASYFQPKPRSGIFLRLLDEHDCRLAVANSHLPAPEPVDPLA